MHIQNQHACSLYVLKYNDVGKSSFESLTIVAIGESLMKGISNSLLSDFMSNNSWFRSWKNLGVL